MSKTMKESVEAVKALITKAEGAGKSDDALKFSQAACNAANALRALEGPGTLKDLLDIES